MWNSNPPPKNDSELPVFIAAIVTKLNPSAERLAALAERPLRSQANILWLMYEMETTRAHIQRRDKLLS